MIELLGLILAAAAGTALAGLWLVLRFLRHVYDRGGIADLTAAAAAVRHACLGLAAPRMRRVGGVRVIRRRRGTVPPR